MTTSQKQILIIGGILAGVSIALGAFGAHAFKTLLIENGRVDTFELANRYHFYHALALLIVGLLYPSVHTKLAQLSAWLLLLGIMLFSGSLYIMAIYDTTSVALITPLGGICFLAGWFLLVMSFYRSNQRR